jgi:hypothetical protein
MPSYKVHIVFGVGQGTKSPDDVICAFPSHKSLRSAKVVVLFDYCFFQFIRLEFDLKNNDFLSTWWIVCLFMRWIECGFYVGP